MASNRYSPMTAGLGQQPRQQQSLLQTPSMQLTMRIMAARMSFLRKFVREAAEENPYLQADMPAMPVSSAGAVDMNGFATSTIRPISLHVHIEGQINQIIDRKSVV